MKKDNSIVVGAVGVILLLIGFFLTLAQVVKQQPSYTILIGAGIAGIAGIISLAFSMRD